MTGKGCVAYHDDSYREGTGTLRLAGLKRLTPDLRTGQASTPCARTWAASSPGTRPVAAADAILEGLGRLPSKLPSQTAFTQDLAGLEATGSQGPPL